MGNLPLYNDNMSFVLEALRDKPQGLWLFDSVSPFVDYSGYSRSGTKNGTQNKYVCILNGTNYSTVFNSTNIGTFASNVFIKTREYDSFSLEATIRVISPTTGVQLILGHTNYDGLVIDGSILSFVTKYSNTGECRASYTLPYNKRIHVVAVHTENKNQLYVDGELVAESYLSETQLNDTYESAETNLSAGNTATTQAIAMGSVGIYNLSLPSDAVERHYSYSTTETNEIFEYFRGDTFDFSNEFADVMFRMDWNSEGAWQAATLDNVIFDNDALVPMEINGTSLTGKWRDAVDLYDFDVITPIESVVLNWEGEGVQVNVSIDSETWIAVTKNRKISLIPTGFVPTGQELYVEVFFPGQIVDDQSFISNMKLTAFTSHRINVDEFSNVIFTGDVHINNSRPTNELADDWGTFLNGGSAVVTPNPDDSSYKTIEIWFKPMTSGNFTLVDARTSESTFLPYVVIGGDSQGTLYLNGDSYTTPQVGEWSVIHLVTAAEITTPININKSYTGAAGGNVQIGKVVLYKNQLPADDIKALVTGYFGNRSNRFLDNSVVGVTENVSPASIYAHDWAISVSG